MSKDDDDSLDDVNSLMKMIGGKKKDTPPREQKEAPVSPAPPVQPAPARSPSDSGDFSALMKRLGMANREGTAPGSRTDRIATPPPPPPPIPAEPEPEQDQYPDFEDLLEDELQSPPRQEEPEPEPIFEPIPEPVPEPKPDIGGRDVRSSLGKLFATMNTAGTAAPPAGTSPAPVTLPAQEERPPVIEIIDEDPKAAIRKAKSAKKAKIATGRGRTGEKGDGSR